MLSAPVYQLLCTGLCLQHPNLSSPATAIWLYKRVCIVMCMCMSACSSHTRHLCIRLCNQGISVGFPDYGSMLSIWACPTHVGTAVFVLRLLYLHEDCSGCPWACWSCVSIYVFWRGFTCSVSTTTVCNIQCCLQIHSSIQHATLMVNSFPRPADPNTLLELLAQQHEEPSIEILMSPSFKDDLQHSANWETVKDYISSLTPENVHGHCPFLQRNNDNAS